MVTQYDFDGMELDFARAGPGVLPAGAAWEHRHELTAFVASVRAMTLAAGARRGRPFLLAACVPETLAGCAFDGMDVAAWCRAQLVDILVLGCRNFEVDAAIGRRIILKEPTSIET